MRPGIDPAHLILALFRVHAAKIRLPNPANFSGLFKTTESHYSHARRVDASRHR
jgi:hypothetical protein